MARLAASLFRSVAPDAAVRVYPKVAMRCRFQRHRFCVAEIAAIGNIHPIVTGDALRHRREIRFAGDFSSVDTFVARQAGNRRDVLVMREMRQSGFAGLLDRWRNIVTLQAHCGLRQIVVFDARAPRHGSMAGGAFQLQCEMRAVREIGAGRRGDHGKER